MVAISEKYFSLIKIESGRSAYEDIDPVRLNKDDEFTVKEFVSEVVYMKHNKEALDIRHDSWRSLSRYRHMSTMST